MVQAGFADGAVVKNSSANARKPRDVSSITGLGRSPGGGHGNLLQYSYLENPMDRGAWQGSSLWSHKVLDMTESLSRMYMCGLSSLTCFCNL